MLSNIHRIFDPMGLLIPVLLQAKLLLRVTWSNKDIEWDDPLAGELCEQWRSFLTSLLSLDKLIFLRSLFPEEEVVGMPSELNPADWCTKQRSAEKISDSFWKDGPPFLRKEPEETRRQQDADRSHLRHGDRNRA